MAVFSDKRKQPSTIYFSLFPFTVFQFLSCFCGYIESYSQGSERVERQGKCICLLSLCNSLSFAPADILVNIQTEATLRIASGYANRRLH